MNYNDLDYDEINRVSDSSREVFLKLVFNFDTDALSTQTEVDETLAFCDSDMFDAWLEDVTALVVGTIYNEFNNPLLYSAFDDIPRPIGIMLSVDVE